MSEVDPTITSERRAAIRALLRRPLIVATGPSKDDLPGIRRHAQWLREYFNRQLGYRLVVEAGFARLYKTGLGFDPTHPATRTSGAPFSPRTYPYLALTPAVLSSGPEQTLLSTLVSDVRSAAAEAQISLADTLPERRKFAAAVRHLIDLGIVTETEGTVSAYADDGVSEVLLTINREVLRHLVAGPLATTSSADNLVVTAAKPGVGGVRHQVRQHLVEHPVTYLDDLGDIARYWMRNEQRRESRWLREYVGLDLEVRGEGVAVIDPDDELTDLTFPGVGTVAQAALLTIEQLVEQLRPAKQAPLTIAVPIPDGLVDDIVTDLAEQHRRSWARSYVDNSEQLASEVVDLLIASRLLARAPAETVARTPDSRSDVPTTGHPGPGTDATELGHDGDLEDEYENDDRGEGDEAEPTVSLWQDANAARLVRLRPERVVDVSGARGPTHPGQLLLLAAAARYAPTLSQLAPLNDNQPMLPTGETSES